MTLLWTAQAVVFWSRPPYQLIVSEAEVPSFITENMPPRKKVVLTYLKQVPEVLIEKVPPPVITVGLAQRLVCALAVCGSLAIRVNISTETRAAIRDVN